MKKRMMILVAATLLPCIVSPVFAQTDTDSTITEDAVAKATANAEVQLDVTGALYTDRAEKAAAAAVLVIKKALLDGLTLEQAKELATQSIIDSVVGQATNLSDEDKAIFREIVTAVANTVANGLVSDIVDEDSLRSVVAATIVAAASVTDAAIGNAKIAAADAVIVSMTSIGASDDTTTTLAAAAAAAVTTIVTAPAETTTETTTEDDDVDPDNAEDTKTNATPN
jgi:hypothetical protein